MILGGCRSFHVFLTTGPKLTQCLRVKITFLMKVKCLFDQMGATQCKMLLLFFFFHGEKIT